MREQIGYILSMVKKCITVLVLVDTFLLKTKAHHCCCNVPYKFWCYYYLIIDAVNYVSFALGIYFIKFSFVAV